MDALQSDTFEMYRHYYCVVPVCKNLIWVKQHELQNERKY